MSNENYTATHRIVQFHSQLGNDALLVKSMRGYEGLSKLFCYEFVLVSEEKKISPKTLINTETSFNIIAENQQQQVYQGIITEFSANAFKSGNFYLYSATLRPWLWQLSKRRNYAVFQQMTVIEIIEKILTDYSRESDYVSHLTLSYPALDYCVQYNETDLEFVTRLLEENGIYYYFIHSDTSHKLVLGDAASHYEQGNTDALSWHCDQPGLPGLTAWQHHYKSIMNKYTVNSHDFTRPTDAMIADTNSIIEQKNNTSAQSYCYTNNFSERQQGESIAKTLLEISEADYDHVCAESNYMSLRSGYTVKVDADYFANEDHDQYVVSELRFQFIDPSFNDSTQTSSYHNFFSALPATVNYRPEYTQQKPIALGVHEAIITGSSGEALYTDQYGRYKVKFYWDRNSTDDEQSSCWVRAVQHWDGILRVGTPVIIGFINNDVNQPIILGPVHDQTQMPLYSLTDNKTRSGLKRRPGSNGDDTKYNHLYFEDKEQSELFGMYAGKDMQVDIEENRQTTLIKGNDQLTLQEGNFKISLENGDCVLEITGDVTIKCTGDMNFTSDQNVTMKAAQGVTIEAGSQMQLKSAMGNWENSGILSLKGSMIKEN